VQLGVKVMCQPCGVPHGVVCRSAKIGRHTNFADSKQAFVVGDVGSPGTIGSGLGLQVRS
jgi:hypothetical protein